MIVEKISPLIYKLQVEEGKSIVVHVNRLKRAKVGPEANRNMLKIKKPSSRRNESRLSKVMEESQEEEVEIPRIQVREVDENEDRDTDEESSEISPTVEDQQHPEWTPETRYLRRKIADGNNKSLEGTNDSPYAL
jgi:hypothetical protein